MNSYYEKYREESEEIVVRRNEAPCYPVHFHANLEIFIVGDGVGSIFLDGNRQTLAPFSIAVVNGYTPHGYQEVGKGDTCILVIPFSLLGGFYVGKNLAVANPVLCDKTLCQKLLFIVDEYLLGGIAKKSRERRWNYF